MLVWGFQEIRHRRQLLLYFVKAWVLSDLMPLPGALIATVTLKSAMSIWPKPLFLCFQCTLRDEHRVLDLKLCSDLGAHRGCGTPWRYFRQYLCIQEVHQHGGLMNATLLGCLSKWRGTFSPPDSTIAGIFWGTWTSRHLGSKIFSMKGFLLWFSSAAIIDSGLHELEPLLHPVFYVPLSFGVWKAFHVLILCPYWIHFKNTFFFF